MSRFLNLKTFFSRYAQPASDSPTSHVSAAAGTAAPAVDPDLDAAASLPAARPDSASAPTASSPRKRTWPSNGEDTDAAIRPAKLPRSRQSSAGLAPTPVDPTLTSSLTTLSQTPSPLASAPNTAATGQGPPTLLPSTQDDQESRPSFVRSSQDSEREEQILPAMSSDDDDDDEDDSENDRYRHRATTLLQQLNSTLPEDESDSSSDISDAPVRNIQDALKGSNQTPTHRTLRQTRAQTGVKAAPETYYPEWQYFREEDDSTDVPSHKRYRFSLKKLVRQQKLDDKVVQQLALARQNAELQSKEDEGGEHEEEAADVDLLSRVVQDADDQDRAGRVAEALARSRSNGRDVDWHFFDVVDIEPPSGQTIEDGRADAPVWAAEPLERKQAFLSGFAVDWDRLRTASVAGRRLSRFRYPETEDSTLLEAHNHHEHMVSSRESNAHEVRQMLAVLGASRSALDLSAKVMPQSSIGIAWSVEQRKRILEYLRRTTHVAEHSSPSVQATQLEYLLRMLLDSRVAMDAEVLLELRDAVITSTRCLEASKPSIMAGKTDWLFQIGSWLFDTVEHPLLQMRLVSALPSYHGSLHALRRRLALAFFLEDRSMLQESMENLGLTDAIISRLKSSRQFDTSYDDIDYELLSASIYLLDIGLDSGFGRPAPDQPKQDQTAFNSKVDHLAQCIHKMEARIKDTGTAHVSKTEAKSAADRLKNRLQYGVRTRQIGKDRVFGRPAGGMALDHGGSKDIMTKFLQPTDDLSQ